MYKVLIQFDLKKKKTKILMYKVLIQFDLKKHQNIDV